MRAGLGTHAERPSDARFLRAGAHGHERPLRSGALKHAPSDHSIHVPKQVRTRLPNGLRSRSAVAAIEFALIVPVMVLLSVGVFDLSQAVILWQEIYYAARSIPYSASVVSIQADRSTSLTTLQAQQMMSAVYAEIPWLADGIANGTRSVTLSSITWVPISGCTPNNNPNTPTLNTNCYTPALAWSLAYPGGTGDRNLANWVTETRSCAVPPSQTTPTGAIPPPVPPLPGVDLQLTSLRTLSVSKPDPILVADIHLQYVPYLYQHLLGTFDFWASAYASVRSVDPTLQPQYTYTKLTPSGTAGSCAGWP